MNQPKDSHINFNINDLTISEIVTVEDLTGLPFDALTDPDKPKGRMLQALAFISKRRENPDYTFEMAGELSISMESEELDFTDESE
jgi:hypothetical protein|tara:strand:+ start:255 stop:512 length:258 start_codon:yes stop_codon:yes gene_type:complete